MAAEAQRIRLGTAAYAVCETLPLQTRGKLLSGRTLQEDAWPGTAPLRIRQWHVP